MGMNLNKKSITLNLNSVEAKEIVKKLVLEADVLVENFKAGTMQRMGLSYEELLVVKPDLIYCSVTGYGQNGPKAGEAAYDGAIQASSGMMSQTGHPTTGPTRTGFMPVDMSTALNTAFAISTSLYRKAQTGKGQYIDIAMMDTAVVMQAAQYDNYLNQGNLVGLLGNASPTKQPTANLFPTRDGFIQVTALSQSQIEKLFDALGKLEELEQPIFKTSEARVKNSDAVNKFLSKALKRNTTSYWMTNLSKAGIPVAEVRELPEVIEDPQFESREVFESIVSPLKSDESVTLVKAGYVMSKDGPTVHLNPPKLGEHTNEILGSLGYSEASISEFRQAGII